ncbi:3-isopropylmalate dehydratase, small subunit [Segniliparus rotundus DSM 44985]|uniref:3-isopropylmalate dehydratase small subunit n=1 Tax=Segniliparus rotundus (strain ATCC BAA-972 / CDC 1076 / CIP 108378 / DSM 44985 / JCM 13578) TaxID=640132 RepID=D6Z7D2_SEGRD|nr:3-isopropylmalate dehydratase small subunit [Segniliparus rotundus]ADG97862.1 3-isopropylmalate dehydratase, small subunit [Segniliparus rotundus DSM 44985]
MEPFTRHTGVGVPLRRFQVDTDQIIPAEYLKRVTRTGFEDGLFASWRSEPGFILNRPPYDQGSVLVAGSPFGVGSSREHAVWALWDFGFRAVVAAEFGDIFRGNAGKSGLLTAQVTQPDVELLWKVLEEQPGMEVAADLVAKTITAGPVTVPFHIDDGVRHRLLEGLDDVALTLQYAQELAAFEASRPSWMPTTGG